MPEETVPAQKLGRTSVSRLWLECGLLVLAGDCSCLSANATFSQTGHIDVRTTVALLGVTATAILGYMNRNAARHSAAKDAETTPDAYGTRP